MQGNGKQRFGPGTMAQLANPQPTNAGIPYGGPPANSLWKQQGIAKSVGTLHCMGDHKETLGSWHQIESALDIWGGN